MKLNILTLIFFVLIALSFNDGRQSKRKYLPVSIFLFDSTSARNRELLISLKGSFSKYKIKTVSKVEMETMTKNETERVARDYYATVGDGDWNKMKSYLSYNMNYVANYNSIHFKADSEGNLTDTIRWLNRPVPMNFSRPRKNPWKLLIIDSLRFKTMLEITDEVVSRIIESGELAKE